MAKQNSLIQGLFQYSFLENLAARKGTDCKGWGRGSFRQDISDTEIVNLFLT